MNEQFGGLDLFVKYYKALPEELRTRLEPPGTPDELKDAFRQIPINPQPVSLMDLLGALTNFANYDAHVHVYLHFLLPSLFVNQAPDEATLQGEVANFLKNHFEILKTEQVRTIKVSLGRIQQVDKETVKILKDSFINEHRLLSQIEDKFADAEKRLVEEVNTEINVANITDVDTMISLRKLTGTELWFAGRFCDTNASKIEEFITPPTSQQQQQQQQQQQTAWDNKDLVQGLMGEFEDATSMLDLFYSATRQKDNFVIILPYLKKLMPLDEKEDWCPADGISECAQLIPEIKNQIVANQGKFLKEQEYTIQEKLSKYQVTLEPASINQIWDTLKQSFFREYVFAGAFYQGNELYLEELLQSLKDADDGPKKWAVCEKVIQLTAFFAAWYLHANQAKFKELINPWAHRDLFRQVILNPRPRSMLDLMYIALSTKANYASAKSYLHTVCNEDLSENWCENVDVQGVCQEAVARVYGYLQANQIHFQEEQKQTVEECIRKFDTELELNAQNIGAIVTILVDTFKREAYLGAALYPDTAGMNDINEKFRTANPGPDMLQAFTEAKEFKWTFAGQYLETHGAKFFQILSNL